MKNDHSKSSIKFCANGRLKHPEFVNCLRKMDYGLPAKYMVEWDETKQAWIGILEEVPELKDEQEIVKKVSARRKRANVKA